MCNMPIYFLPALKAAEINERFSVDIFGLWSTCRGDRLANGGVLERLADENQIC